MHYVCTYLFIRNAYSETTGEIRCLKFGQILHTSTYIRGVLTETPKGIMFGTRKKSTALDSSATNTHAIHVNGCEEGGGDEANMPCGARGSITPTATGLNCEAFL